MIVGFLGTIPFIASRWKVRTFDEFGRQSDSRWQSHDIIGQKPLLEFVGPNLEEISFKMLLRKDLGVSPENEVQKLRKLRDEGTVVPLIIGNRPVGNGFWVITAVSEKHDFWSKFGNAQSIEVTVTLKEYYEDGQVASVKEAWKNGWKGIF